MSSISVALCTYQGRQYLREQLASLIQQTVLPDEIIICDDASSDGTLQILREFESDSPVPVQIVTAEERLGVVQNFAKAITLCNHRYIYLCDQDDYWYPEKIETYLQVFQS